MSQLEEKPDNSENRKTQGAEELLQSVTQKLEYLQQNLTSELSQDVERLKKEKSQLIGEIEELQATRQQQLFEQQQLVEQIAPVLANQLIEQLRQQFEQSTNSWRNSNQNLTLPPGQSPLPLPPDIFPNYSQIPEKTASNYNENAYRLIASLDSTLRATFGTLQQDLSSYQSHISQQLGQMYNLEQQGEMFLEMLVSRLRTEIQSASVIKNAQISAEAKATNSYLKESEVDEYEVNSQQNSEVSYPNRTLVPEAEILNLSEPSATVKPQLAWKKPLGFILILCSLLVLSFEYLLIDIIFQKQEVLGLWELGGFISPRLGNSLLVLWLRMLILLPLMSIALNRLYPLLWQDIQQFTKTKDRSTVVKIMASSCLLFLSQLLIYLALAFLAPGTAITIFFIYPIVTLLLAWVLFGVRPNLWRSSVIISVLLGVFLSAFGDFSRDISRLGVGAALCSGITFAFYLILTQTCAKKLNPISFSWINLVVIFTASSLCLALPLPVSWGFELDLNIEWLNLIISSFVLAGTALASYLCNHLGMGMIGAARASIIGATVPLLTTLLAFVVLEKATSELQGMGLVLVTLGVISLSCEQLLLRFKVRSSE
ncbi:MAG: EamA family transporter [Coleofasciculaceae cyanobacterium]